jgi:hypothetical protein
MNKVRLLSRSIVQLAFVGSTLLIQASVVHAGGISNFEGVQCVAMSDDIGADTGKCADTTLADCKIPDWFPTDSASYAGTVTTVDSYPMSATVRYNDVSYASPDETPWVDYRRYEHDWYSEAGTLYGPALPSWGHLWNAYDRTGLIKSVSCDVHGTLSYP